VPGQRPAELQRDERIAAGLRLDPAQRGLGKRAAEPDPQHPPQRPYRQRPHRQQPGRQPGPVQLQRQLGARPVRPLRAQQPDPLGLQPASRESDGGLTGLVKPLNVVDGHEHRRGHRECCQCRPERGRDQPGVRGVRRSFLFQQGNSQRASLRGRQVVSYASQLPFQQVGQSGEGEPYLAAGRGRLEYCVPSFGGGRDGCAEQRCLALPGRPGQHKALR
jgi:hypothetical protein